MPINRRQLLANLGAGAAAGALSPLHAEPTPAAIPIETFFADTLLSDAILSPAGTKVAMRVAVQGGRKRIAVLDLATMVPTPVAGFEEIDVDDIRWVNDQRLLFDTDDERVAQADRRYAPGLFAVDADGEGYRQLAQRFQPWLQDQIESKLLPWNTFMLRQVGAQDSNDVLVLQPAEFSEKGASFFRLLKLNTRTGRAVEIETPPRSYGWLVDTRGKVLAAMTERDHLASVHWQGEKPGEWRKLFDDEIFASSKPSLVWADGAGTVYALANTGDRTAVYAFDPATGKLADKPLLGVARYDVEPTFIYNDAGLLGLRFLADAEVTVWLDDTMKALQAEVDRALPVTNNQLGVPRRGSSPWIVVRAFADTRPAEFLLYNKQTKKLTRLGSLLPGIKPSQMSEMDFVSYKARDGREIPAYLTVPRGAAVKKNLPMVVLVHGGPWVRDSWHFNREVQFLASRGYAVLQPQFRGSSGFGEAHLKASFKQWGQAMQDDLADAAQWAIAQGIADPKRIAIAGASYGGYAALMGVIRNPELFCCAVEWVGVTDLELMYSAHWSDASDQWKRYGYPTMVGDPKADAAMLRANSPIQLVDKLKRPVLMAHGGADKRVPIEHGTRMYRALKAGNPQVEWVEYGAEGHGWALRETQINFWGKVEKFLARYLAA